MKFFSFNRDSEHANMLLFKMLKFLIYQFKITWNEIKTQLPRGMVLKLKINETAAFPKNEMSNFHFYFYLFVSGLKRRFYVFNVFKINEHWFRSVNVD